MMVRRCLADFDIKYLLLTYKIVDDLMMMALYEKTGCCSV